MPPGAYLPTYDCFFSPSADQPRNSAGADFEQVDFGTNSKWMDVANLVMSNNQCPPPGTSGEGQGGYTKAYVARERVTPGDEDARDPKYLRSVMVLCDILWEHMQEPMQHTLGRLKNGTESIDFQTSSVEFVDFLTSKLILHEVRLPRPHGC